MIEDDSEAKNDEVPMDNDVAIEKDDRSAEKKKHDIKPPCFLYDAKMPCENSWRIKDLHHDEFWTLNYKDHKQWISSHVMEVCPVRRSSNEDSHRNFTRKYFLPNSLKVQVCQKMFLNTLGISERDVGVALDNGGNNIIADDKRRKYTPKHKIGDVDKKIVDNHIMSFNPSIAPSTGN